MFKMFDQKEMIRPPSDDVRSAKNSKETDLREEESNVIYPERWHGVGIETPEERKNSRDIPPAA